MNRKYLEDDEAVAAAAMADLADGAAAVAESDPIAAGAADAEDPFMTVNPDTLQPEEESTMMDSNDDDDLFFDDDDDDGEYLEDDDAVSPSATAPIAPTAVVVNNTNRDADNDEKQDLLWPSMTHDDDDDGDDYDHDQDYDQDSVRRRFSRPLKVNEITTKILLYAAKMKVNDKGNGNENDDDGDGDDDDDDDDDVTVDAALKSFLHWYKGQSPERQVSYLISLLETEAAALASTDPTQASSGEVESEKAIAYCIHNHYALAAAVADKLTRGLTPALYVLLQVLDITVVVDEDHESSWIADIASTTKRGKRKRKQIHTRLTGGHRDDHSTVPAGGSASAFAASDGLTYGGPPVKKKPKTPSGSVPTTSVSSSSRLKSSNKVLSKYGRDGPCKAKGKKWSDKEISVLMREAQRHIKKVGMESMPKGNTSAAMTQVWNAIAEKVSKHTVGDASRSGLSCWKKYFSTVPPTTVPVTTEKRPKTLKAIKMTSRKTTPASVASSSSTSIRTIKKSIKQTAPVGGGHRAVTPSANSKHQVLKHQVTSSSTSSLSSSPPSSQRDRHNEMISLVDTLKDLSGRLGMTPANNHSWSDGLYAKIKAEYRDNGIKGTTKKFTFVALATMMLASSGCFSAERLVKCVNKMLAPDFCAEEIKARIESGHAAGISWLATDFVGSTCNSSKSDEGDDVVAAKTWARNVVAMSTDWKVKKRWKMTRYEDLEAATEGLSAQDAIELMVIFGHDNVQGCEDVVGDTHSQLLLAKALKLVELDEYNSETAKRRLKRFLPKSYWTATNEVLRFLSVLEGMKDEIFDAAMALNEMEYVRALHKLRKVNEETNRIRLLDQVSALKMQFKAVQTTVLGE